MRNVGILVLLLALTACGTSEAEEAVKRSMLEPAATQFRDVKTCDADQNLIVGDFNAKNRVGGYEGFKPFYYTEHRAIFAEDGDFAKMTDRCYGKVTVDPTDKDAVAAAKALRDLDAATTALEQARQKAASEVSEAAQAVESTDTTGDE